MKKFLTSATISLALLAGAPALAQAQQSGGQTNPAASQQQTNFDDAELRQFVEAQSGINDIRDEYMAKIEAADSQEKAQELQMEANDEMVTVIDEAGLDIPTYNAIATAYNSEPDVREKVDSLM
ncbi:DUF4168 domain-containing protein [uncultured Marinobacter sp.]|uniref:DUF4168 domain-containing protein n=1 Tax=uncultured Marinobacter sp. TaxID=187379 RepID=UPI0030DAA386|tara:strand:- start:961 stop:1332 length:372 start_codon:yes stop_codon:yes gene_type:complete